MSHWVTAASVLLAFLLYYNTLEAGFVYDDRRAILSNPDVIGHTPFKSLFENDFWGTPLSDLGSHGSYRPLCIATYRMNYALSGFKPWSYHFLNIVFHCTATALVVATAKRMLPSSYSKVGTAVTGLVFAAHPIHTEAVAGVVGRADLVACNFFLLSFLLYSEHIKLREESRNKCRQLIKSNVQSRVGNNEHQYRPSCYGFVQQIVISLCRLIKASRDGPLRVLKTYETKQTLKLRNHFSDSVIEGRSELMFWVTLSGTLLLAVAGTLCKEPAIMVLPLCLFYDFLYGIRLDDPYSKHRWKSVCVLTVGGAALFYWRLRLSSTPTAFALADNPTSRDPSIITRTLTFAYLPIFNFFLFLYPFYLSFDWSMEAIPRITSIFDLRNLSTIIFYLVLSKVSWRTILCEIKKHQERMMMKSYKKHNLKLKQRWNNNNKQFLRVPECIERKGHHALHKEHVLSKKLLCSCSGCKHPLSDEHTSACRTINNNNTMTHFSSCVCPTRAVKTKIQIPSKHYRSGRIVFLTGLAFMVLPFIPATNLLFYVGFVVAERVLYMPSVGFCLLIGLGAGITAKQIANSEVKKKIFMMSLLIALLAMCGNTMRRNQDWKEEESLFRSALHINPPKAYGNLGSVLSAQGRANEAEAAFRRALKYRPNMADVHYNLGILLQNQRRFGEAIKSFEKAIYFRPSMALAYVNLGASLMADGRLAEAASALRAGARTNGDRVRDRREHDAARVSALVQLAALHSQRAHWHKALAAYKEALQILPSVEEPIVGWTRHSILTMVSDVHIHLQQWSQAERVILTALDAAPYNAGTHAALAQVLARNESRAMEAEIWFQKAVTLAPNDPSIRDQFGMFLRSQRRLHESAEQLVTAARLAPTDSGRAATAARALRDARRCRAAEIWYSRAVQLKPEDAEYHSNLGAILHLNGKYSSAATSYRRALQLQPNDEITLTNLKRVRTLMKKQRRKTT